ncbi:hypothetical protein IMG5_100070 [Ichthyophthirius multifiliis]|uniref:RPGR-interacting protein 1 first C2 domain-containing protein n=1 Tax=Ichthyophthirius multifiliis TaxID=5932 RepID=G0QSB2_ICHMU|nr:hypothetical protein IMG5_100070 [Ichthyophthirius multifiliis]EGR31859.1 hypothetical protein IMG5_100070 [Ichthyophthirius multifiliis]|eukprot:XP_004035345.1 hypothetical protein IMG5_100070 [Ichthyophthirius multifiliis]
MDHKTYLKTLGEITMNSHKLKIQGLDELLENNQDEKNQVYVKNLQQEIEQLKRDKGEIAVHLEKIQTMLKIQMDITQEKESIHKAEKEAFELKYNALLSQAQELAQISDMKENGCNYFDFWIGLCQIYQGNLFAITNGKISENEEILVFSTVDFYDHDIQTTPISQAKNQTYFNFQCSYKITTKDDFLLYLSTGSIKIELYAAVGKDALLLGSVEVPLLYLFQNNRQECISAVLNQKCQLNFAETIIGQIEIKARLRYPISNQIKLFVQKNSTQDKELEEQKDLALEEYEDNKDQSTKRKLVVIIDKAQGFNEKSSTFIYYQIQNKDYYTKSVPGSQPKYDHHQIHDICHLDKFKNILNKVPLEFVVFDDFAPLTNEYEQHDIVGIASTKLDGLNSNLIIDTVLTIYNDKKIKVGLLYIKVFWYEYQDQIQISSKFGQGLLAKQWEKDFTLKLAKTLKNRQLNTNNGFMIFDRNNDKIISKEEFLNTCLGTLNMVEFNRDEVLYYYSKQKQPFDKIAFEQLLRPYMLDDISKLKYLEEISILQKAAQNNEEENKEQYAAQERLKNNENQQQERMNQMQSIKELNNILNDNTKQMTTQKDEVLREMIGIMIVSEMKKKARSKFLQKLIKIKMKKSIQKNQPNIYQNKIFQLPKKKFSAFCQQQMQIKIIKQIFWNLLIMFLEKI